MLSRQPPVTDDTTAAFEFDDEAVSVIGRGEDHDALS
jgi:hypothetical protein